MSIPMAMPIEDDHADPEVGDATLEGLAEAWEESLSIRRRVRNIGSLLEWPSANAVGLPSMTLYCKIKFRCLMLAHVGTVDLYFESM